MATRGATHATLLMEQEEETENGRLLYRASFDDTVDRYVSYMTWKYVLICLAFVLLYGIGIFMLMLLPAMRWYWRRELLNRRLYVTSENIVYKTNVPACFGCCGYNKTEKHILLHLVTDVVLQQGCFEARWGLFSLKIENPGQMGQTTPGADVVIQGIGSPQEFKKLVLAAGSARRAGRQLCKDDIDMFITKGTSLYGGTEYGEPVSSSMYEQARPVPGVGESAALAAKMDEMNASLLVIADLLRAQQAGGSSRGPAPAYPSYE